MARRYVPDVSTAQLRTVIGAKEAVNALTGTGGYRLTVRMNTTASLSEHGALRRPSLHPLNCPIDES